MPQSPPSAPWDAFTSYGLLHIVTVALCAALIAGLVLAGRAAGRNGAERRLRRGLAGFAGLFWLAHNIWWNWGGIDTYNGLPLHICDIGGILAPFALLTQNRWARATLYFWSVAFTLQAYIQPTLTVGPAHLQFWGFWISHTLIVATAAYEIGVLGFRPDWRDLLRAGAVSLGYFAVVLPVDVWLGANYGYVGNPPPPNPIPPFVAWLGPWPQRLVVIVGLAALAFVLALLPWRLAPSAREDEQVGAVEAPGELRP